MNKESKFVVHGSIVHAVDGTDVKWNQNLTIQVHSDNIFQALEAAKDSYPNADITKIERIDYDEVSYDYHSN